MTLVEFLAARFDEEIDVAVDAIEERSRTRYSPGHEPEIPDMYPPYVNSDTAHIGVAMGAERFLSDVEAKIKILDLHRLWPTLITKAPVLNVDTLRLGDSIAAYMTQQMEWLTTDEYIKRFGEEPPTSALLRALAQPYTSHPDYDPTWEIS